MSAFEVTITPTRNRNKRSEALQPTIVCMAPFSAKSIVQFEDVPLTKTAKRVLRIMNPSDDDIEVKVTKNIRAEHNLSIDWTEKVILAKSEVEMQLIWVPKMDTVCKETLQLSDNRNFRKDIMIIFKTRSNKPMKTKKFPTISSSTSSASHIRTMRLKSPTNAIKHKRATISNNNSAQLQQRQTDKQRTETLTKQQPQIVEICRKSSSYSAPKNLHVAPLSESNSSIANKRSNGNFNGSPVFSTTNDIPKENISPLTPNNVMNLIDNLNFTPAQSISKNPTINIDNLANLPTPVSTFNHGAPFDHIRPRKLTTAEYCDAIVGKTPEIHIDLCETNISGIITNKTFDVKVTDDINLSLDSMDATGICAPMNHTTTIMCTPIGRALTMIQEEDDQISSINETKNKESNHNHLKRDIKLVGTPLQKYSLSMKDLSWKSPQEKLPIQGSMPNLSEMETIRSIEQNRYFHQSGTALNRKNDTNTSNHRELNAHNDDDLNLSNLSVVSQAELGFNQTEILAQSSVFNLNEIGISKTKKQHDSPNSVYKKYSSTTLRGSSPKKSFGKRNSSSENKYEKNMPQAASHKRSLHELSFSDTPSTESLIQSDNDSLTVSRKHNPPVSPPKRQRFDISGDHSFLRPTPVSSTASRRDWSRPKNVGKLAKTLSLVKKPITPTKSNLEPRIKLYNSELYFQTHINPDPFAATTTCDPFLATTMYLDERAVELHQIDFRKWLNALVTIPEDLDADCNTKIDVGKLFNEVRNKELTLAPTKEECSMNYLTKHRLESLRSAAVELFFSEEMRIPCTKVAVYINKQSLRIRHDRNLHLDVVMQRYILELLLCFNPLWLRLGLEVVYGEKIHLNSNRDIVGLSTFILNRLFRDKFLEQKYSKAYTLSEEYAEHIKKFTLQKTLFLLLFLDKAKSKRIVKHNPCLFVKKSPYKETRDILLRISSELLANVGDITRDLKRIGYVLQHKQNFLDEFDYAFNNLAVDLRDGVRLTRIMEIILLRDDLSQQLRVPAISRLQRVFNVNLALKALSDADFQLNGDITGSDIVDGHREKTLSLLWQVIYKFRSPKFHAAARIVQKWWRNNWLRVVIRRRVKRKEFLRKEKAAIKIQAIFRGIITRRFVRVYKEQRIKAAIILQKYIRRFLVQKHLMEKNHAAIVIQRSYRSYLIVKQYRDQFLRLRTSVIFIQRIFRRRLLSRKLLLLADEARRQREQKRNAAAAYIQCYWRSYCETHIIRSEFLSLRHHVINAQQRFRANRKMRHDRQAFLQLRQTAIFVQQKFKAKLLMRQQRQAYLHIRDLIVRIQQRRRGQLLMRSVRTTYVHERQVIIKLQQRIRATIEMRKQRTAYQNQRNAACILQRRYRAQVAMKLEFEKYQRVRNSIITIQLKWRATLLARSVRVDFIAIQYFTIVLQQKYRSRKLMRTERANYLEYRASVIIIQRRYRAQRKMIECRNEYQKKLQSVMIIQRRYRAYKQMRFQRAKYQGTRAAVLCLQQHIRAYLQMKQQRAEYLRLKAAAIRVQRAWHAKCAMRQDRIRFKNLQEATINIQRRYRAKLEMKRQVLIYNKHRQAIIALQQRWRATLIARNCRQNYAIQRSSIVIIQQRFRALRTMRTQRQTFLMMREKVICIQRFYRSYKLMQCEREDFLRKREAVICIQRWYRSIQKMRIQKSSYRCIRSSCIIIQRKWRATLESRQQRTLFIAQREKIIYLQRKFRATLAMRIASTNFQRQKAAAIVLQRRYRARLEMLKIRGQYKLIVSLVICIQRKFRARLQMLKQRQEFLQLRHYTIYVQQKFRGKQLMVKESEHFQLLRRTVVSFQAHARGVLARRRLQELMTPEMMELRRRKHAAKIIQRFYRGYRVRKRFRSVALRQIRQNIISLRSTSTVMNSLRYKLMDSVRILRGRFSVAEILHVLQRLEPVSRTVPHLLLPHSEFFSSFCYGIMAQAIRSEIDKQMIELCSRIILNLARCNHGNSNIFQQNGLVTIAQMLLRWCDKDCEIFNTLCTLIWIFAHCPLKRKIICEFMTTPDALYMLRETKKLVARKEKMKSNDRRIISIGPQQNSFSRRALPSLEPDYGIINKKPYTFISSVYAFHTVLCKLGIEVY